LGDGTTSNRNQPVAVCCNYTYEDISASNQFSVGVRTGGLAVAWGMNYACQLGDGSSTNRCQPVSVCCNYLYKQVATSCCDVSAIKTDGTAVQWGCKVCGASACGVPTWVCSTPQVLPAIG
jgi:alpha-tubulin suppressor-like RCC1 family protein